MYESEIRQAQGIADTLRRLGTLLGHAAAADTAARRFESQWQSLAQRYAGQPPVRVFWQLWHEPLMTINREHLISEAMRLCGGVNVFADLPLLTPSVSWEAAVAADPQLIAGSGREQDTARDFAAWRRFANVSAVKQQRYVSIDGDLIGRMGPRFVEGAGRCAKRLRRRGEDAIPPVWPSGRDRQRPSMHRTPLRSTSYWIPASGSSVNTSCTPSCSAFATCCKRSIGTPA